MKVCVVLIAGLISGCSSAISDAALCQGLKGATDEHAAALLADGGDKSLVTGQNLIAKLGAGCQR